MTVVTLTLFATFSLQLGYLLWKIAADTLPKIGEEKVFVVVKGFLTNVKWVTGYFATFIGWVLLVKALDVGEISLVQPLVSVGDVFLVLMAVFFLKERLLTYEWLGLFLIILGASAISFDGKVVPVTSLNWLYIYLFYGVAVISWLTLMVFRNNKHAEIILALATGVAFGIGGALTKLMTVYIAERGYILESIYFVYNPFFLLVVTANIVGLVLLQISFQRGRASIIIPVQLAVVNIMSVMSGVLLYAESISLFRIFCIIIIIAGAATLQWAGSKKMYSVVYQK